MQEKSISEQFAEVWKQLNYNQRRYVVALQELTTKKEAAIAIDLEPDTIYRWPDIVDVAVDLMAKHIQETTVEMLASAAAKAAMIKVGGLDSGNERLRQEVATEVLDRVMGKPTQRQEIGSPDGGPIKVQTMIARIQDEPPTIPAEPDRRT